MYIDVHLVSSACDHRPAWQTGFKKQLRRELFMSGGCCRGYDEKATSTCWDSGAELPYAFFLCWWTRARETLEDLCRRLCVVPRRFKRYPSAAYYKAGWILASKKKTQNWGAVSDTSTSFDHESVTFDFTNVCIGETKKEKRQYRNIFVGDSIEGSEGPLTF